MSAIFRLATFLVLYFLFTSSITQARYIQNKSSFRKSVPGQFVVEIKKTVLQKKNFSMPKLLSEFGGRSKRIISRKLGLILVEKLASESAEHAQKFVSNLSVVELIEPNYIYSALKVPNDKKYSELWGLKNTGQKDSSSRPGVKGVDIDAEKAWDISTGSKKIVVAVIDTGIDYTIPDLAPNMWVNEAEKAGSVGVDDDGNGFVDDIYGYDFANNDGDPKDDNGHGSHCAGTIGGKGGDGKGVVGVNWNIQLMAVKFLTGNGSGTLEGAVKAIDYANLMGAHILSNSWGGGGFSKILEAAITRANKRELLFVAAAGNESSNNDKYSTYPAGHKIANVVSVASVNNQGKLSRFSNYGAKSVHIAAPGSNILSTTPGGFKSFSGTSMAAPHISGIAALILGESPRMTAAALKARLMSAAKPLASLRGKTISGGMGNAFFGLVNKKAPIDINDPFHWEKVGHRIETLHPYQDNTEEEWSITVPGAKRVSVHFKKFSLRKGGDSVQIFDSKKQMVAEMFGDNDDVYSPAVLGDTVTVKIISDSWRSDFGFEVDHLAVEK